VTAWEDTAALPEPEAPPRDPFDAALVRRAGGLLHAFNEAGVLRPADVHVAATLGRLCREEDETVLLAAALAVRAPRLGHTCVDLDRVRETVVVDADIPTDLDALPWPGSGWVAAVRSSPLTAPGDTDRGPLRLAGARLYLDRYWRYEQRVLDDLRRRVAAPDAPVDADRLGAGLDRLFPHGAEQPDLQRRAAATALARHFTVIAGGPGTGKTTTVVKVLALLADERAGGELPRVALAAPTGKAADRVAQAVHRGVGALDVDDGVRRWLLGLEASTVHRLLGRRPGSDTRFRHDRDNPLPHDVVVVDEASMVSLALMAKLLGAVGPDTRLVFIGDPDQLASVEAGAVLGDIVGPLRAGASTPVAAVTAPAVTAPPHRGGDAAGRSDNDEAEATRRGLADAIVVLRRRHRFAEDSGIAALAQAIGSGDGEAAITLLASGRDDLRWISALGDETAREGPAMGPVRDAVAAAAAPVFAAARAGDGAGALEALGSLRVLCAHRRGSVGVTAWVPAVERWLAARDFDVGGAWYLGRPVLVTRNDYQMNLRNGDVGVVVAGPGGEPTVAFPAADGVRAVSPVRLEDHETVHAMTVHKSQGSQFGHVLVVLPEPGSPILTRELLYTAVTRAESTVTVVGAAEAVRAAVERPIQRASGLRAALWGTSRPRRAPAAQR